MRVLVTGHAGAVGKVVHGWLEQEGHEVRGYDVAEGDDVLDAEALARAVHGCEAVVHLAALLFAPDAELLNTNVVGTFNLLGAAGAAGVRRVVFMSSVNAMGIFGGERAPDYLPFDEDHVCYPSTAYGLSKLMGEEMCEAFTARTGVPTFCLRPPAVWDDATMARIAASREDDHDYEWTPFWDYGCFVHEDDVASAVARALVCEPAGHARALIGAPDLSSRTHGGAELVARLLPGVEWRGGAAFDDDPYVSLMDCSRARALLGWEPRRAWRPR